MLGSRKLLIVLCVVPCILSLVFIGAFAAPAEDFIAEVDIPLETEVVDDVVKSPASVAEETFPAESLLEYGYYSYNVPFANLGTSFANGFGDVYQVSFYDHDGVFVWGTSFSDLPGGKTTFWKTHGNNGWMIAYYDGVSNNLYSPPFDSFNVNHPAYVEFLSSQPSYTIGGNTFTGTAVDANLVSDVAASVFDLGDALITFIMSSWVVMIPLAAWLVILCIGAIRKLVKGV